MAIEVFNRYEHKYIIDENTFCKVLKIINEHMITDEHNEDLRPYTIANIYYDTPDDFLIRKSLTKPEYKEKLRLRSYGVPSLDSKVFLEIKKKFKGIVNKRRTTLKLDEAYDFVISGKAPKTAEYMNAQVMKEIEYFLKIYNPVPKLFIAYDRIAFFEKENPDLRISFDENIRSRRYDLRLDYGDYGKNILPENHYLMEIKTSLAKPLWLADMLTEFNIRRCSFSKYGTEYRNLLSFVSKNIKMAI